MAITATDVMELAARQLSDTSNQRWGKDALRRYVTGILREIALFRPAALGKATTIELAKGAEQSVPSAATQFLGGIRNMGSDGATPGRAVRNCRLGDAEAFEPGWMAGKPGSIVREIYYDPQNPRTFFVYPPAPDPATRKVFVQLRIVEEPVAVDTNNEGNDLPVTADYEPVLVNGVLAFAYSENTDAASADLAQSYAQAFYQAIGADVKVRDRIGSAAKGDRQ